MSALAELSLGPFALLDRLGRGASGEVWRALERRTNRVVAVKVLTVAGDSAERADHLAWRFQREVEAAAQQDHPHIAHIFASGVSNGRPWYSMELIDGLPIDAHASTHGLDLRARLGLLLAVCAGVQHAHDRGVIHRDLKPANILVRADGVPKILDFGLARFLEDGSLGPTLSLDGQLLGTPMFMAPEQASGDASEVGVTADVYALGVILFRLATDAWPFDDTLPPLQLLAAIREGEPRSPRAAKPTLPRDLAAILVKALARTPTERYSSVRALAEDLEHFLAAEPVAARAWTPGYLFRKSLRKHWRAAATILAVMSLAAVLTATWFREKRRAANRQAQTIEQARELLNNAVFDLQGELESLGRPELLAQVVKRMNALADDPVADDRRPLDLRRYNALAKSMRGEMLVQRRDIHGALMAFVEAGNGYEALVRAHPGRDDLRREAAEAHLATSRAAMETKRSIEALAAAKKARAVLAPARARLPLLLATAERQLAFVLRYRGLFDEAEAAIQRGLEVCRAASPEKDAAHLEPDLHLLRGVNLAEHGSAAESRRAVAIAEQLYRARLNRWPGLPDLLEGFARTLDLVAADTLATGDLATTRKIADEARAVRAQVRAMRPAEFWSGHDGDLGEVYAGLARIYFARTEWAAGLDAAKPATEIFAANIEENRNVVHRRIPLVALYREIAQAHLQLGNRTATADAWQDALSHLKMLARKERSEPRWHLDVAEAHLELLRLPPPTHGAENPENRPNAIWRAFANVGALTPLTDEQQARNNQLNERFNQWLAERSNSAPRATSNNQTPLPANPMSAETSP